MMQMLKKVGKKKIIELIPNNAAKFYGENDPVLSLRYPEEYKNDPNIDVRRIDSNENVDVRESVIAASFLDSPIQGYTSQNKDFIIFPNSWTYQSKNYILDIPVLKNHNCIIGTNNHGSVTAYSGDVVYENLRGVSDTNGVAWQTLDPIKVVCTPDEGYELDQILKYDNEDITYLAEASGFFSLYPDTDNDKWIAVFFKKKNEK